MKLSTEKVEPSIVKYDSKWAYFYDKIAALKHRNVSVVGEVDHQTTLEDLKKLRLYVLARARKGQFGFPIKTRLRHKKLHVWRTR
jgi:hypothetical protein